MEKSCIKCGETKDITLFAKGSKYNNGYRGTCKKCHSSYVTQKQKDNPHKRKANPNRKWRRHGLEDHRYFDLYSKHNGKCHSCKDRDGINIDHDHTCCNGSYSCGKCVRGILCSQCNTALGLLNDERNKIISLLEYIG